VSSAVYIALCLVVPAVWGALSYVIFDAIDRRRRERASKTTDGA